MAAALESHPLANLFPLLEGSEFEELVADIKANGLVEPIVMFEDKILDGRNRYRACLAAGVEPAFRPFMGDDPLAYIISLNLRRRHLTAEQKRELIAGLIKAAPEKSDRQIAKTVKVDHKTVASVRAEKEGRGEIPHVAKRQDAKGRQQPAKKFKKATDPPLQVSEEVLQQRAAAAERIRALMGRPKPHDDIGPDSRGEAERLRTRCEELETEKHRLECENLALKTEVAELKARLSKLAPLAPDDPGPIPECLRRRAS
jgi:ParB-like chromosome segregation protein Spo0J